MRDAVTRSFAISDRDIERVICGEAEQDLIDAVEVLANESPEFAAHLHERRSERAAFFFHHPRLPAPPTQSVFEKFAAWLHTTAPMTAPATFAAACAALFIMIPTSTVDTVRDKGAAPEVLVIAKRGERVFHVKPGTLLKQGDALRLEVGCGSAALVVTALHEVDTKQTSVLTDGERVPAKRTVLPGSFVLDGHAGDEELWVACVSDPRLASQTAASMQQGKRPAEVAVMTLHKEP